MRNKKIKAIRRALLKAGALEDVKYGAKPVPAAGTGSFWMARPGRAETMIVLDPTCVKAMAKQVKRFMKRGNQL